MFSLFTFFTLLMRVLDPDLHGGVKFVFSICFETDLVVSVLSDVSIRIRNTETNQKIIFWFREISRKSTEKDWVSVCFGSNWNFFVCFVDTLVFMLHFSFLSVCFETDLFVSVFLKRVQNTETNRNKFFLNFAKQTEN
jgi:hypothetical protein